MINSENIETAPPIVPTTEPKNIKVHVKTLTNRNITI